MQFLPVCKGAVDISKKLGKLARVILIDKNPNHVYSPSFLWLMLGKRSAGQIQKPLAKLGRKGIEFVCDEIARINVESKIVVTNQRSISSEKPFCENKIILISFFN